MKSDKNEERSNFAVLSSIFKINPSQKSPGLPPTAASPRDECSFGISALGGSLKDLESGEASLICMYSSVLICVNKYAR